MAYPRCLVCGPPAGQLFPCKGFYGFQCVKCGHVSTMEDHEARGHFFGPNFAERPDVGQCFDLVRVKLLPKFKCIDPKTPIRMPKIIDELDKQPIPEELLNMGDFAELMGWVCRSYR